jgi:hypothetical protein
MENEKTPTSIGGLGLVGGALFKKWEECSLEEKLDKLRAEIREFRYTSQSVNQIREEIESLREHTHVEGKVQIPFKRNYNGGTACSRMDNLA